MKSWYVTKTVKLTCKIDAGTREEARHMAVADGIWREADVKVTVEPEDRKVSVTISNFRLEP